MRRMISSVVVSVLLGAAPALAQLPPEIMVDRYLLRAERLLEAKDHEGALDMMSKIRALQNEHDLTVPEEFHFKYAQVAFSAGSLQAAVDSVNQYLAAAGREGEFYREALELLDEIEAAAERTPCAGQPKGAECWLEVANQPECYVWDEYFHPDETVTWTGECSGGLAQGTATLTWVWDSGKQIQENTGLLQEGKMHGRWILRNADGTVLEGPYVEGERHGRWVTRSPEKTVREEDGTERREDGTVVGEGAYVAGKRHGQWIERGADGTVLEGPYVEGKRQGAWVFRYESGTVAKGPLWRASCTANGSFAGHPGP